MAKRDSGAMQPIFQAVVGNKVFVAQGVAQLPEKVYRCFRSDSELKYFPFCDDFGPMNMASVIKFVAMLDNEMAAYPNLKIVHCVECGRRALTNAIFLLGAYMILKLDFTADRVAAEFRWVEDGMIEGFRDATFATPDFHLTLLDCWRGLERGKALGWVRLPAQGADTTWGKIDLEEYLLYDDPDQADLHEVVPGKLVAFKGPKDLGGRDFFDDHHGYRHFSAAHYAPIFDALRVTAVVRLNEPEYDAQNVEAHGVCHHELEFPDCTAPPARVVETFFRVVDAARGAVAVHCKAGLGRTGTLIALYMMRSYGFGAREAMGWLRIMRPGSVIGDQQRYLVEVERGILEFQRQLSQQPAAPAQDAAAAARRDSASRAATPAEKPRSARGGKEKGGAAMPPPAAAAALAAQVACGMERRGAARARDGQGAVALGRLPAIKPH